MQRRETMSSSPSSRRGMNIQSSDTQVWPSASLPPSTQALKPRPEALTTDADSLHPAGWKSKMEADLVPGGSHFLGHSWLQACAPHPTPTLAAPPVPPTSRPLHTSQAFLPILLCLPSPAAPTPDSLVASAGDPTGSPRGPPIPGCEPHGDEGRGPLTSLPELRTQSIK